MSTRWMTATAVAAALSVTTVLADPNAIESAIEQSKRAVLNFADLGAIRNWQPEGMDAILIENVHNDWFRATFWAPCYELPFAEAIAFITEPNGSLDRFSSIYVAGERCSFREFERTTEPASDRGRVSVQ